MFAVMWSVSNLFLPEYSALFFLNPFESVTPSTLFCTIAVLVSYLRLPCLPIITTILADRWKWYRINHTCCSRIDDYGM